MTWRPYSTAHRQTAQVDEETADNVEAEAAPQQEQAILLRTTSDENPRYNKNSSQRDQQCRDYVLPAPETGGFCKQARRHENDQADNKTDNRTHDWDDNEIQRAAEVARPDNQPSVQGYWHDCEESGAASCRKKVSSEPSF